MVPGYAWPDPEARAEQLAPVVLELVARIRTDDPTRLCAELLGGLDGWQMWAVVCLLAAAVDPTVHPDILFGWVRHREAIERAAPIVWDDDEQPIEAMDTEQINGLIARLAGEHRSDAEIAEATGLTAGAVLKRRGRMGLGPGLRRGDVRTARAGVA